MNIFDNLPALAPPKAEELCSELNRHLTADIEHVTDPIKWWYKCRDMYPALSCMAIDYLSIPGNYLKFI